MIKMLKGNQKGMTLIEIVVVTAIVGMLTGALGSVSFGVLRHTESSNAHMAAACAMENAARWIAGDGQMSQNTDLTPGAAAASNVKLSRIDPENGDLYEIDYFLSGNDLRRRESIDSVVQTERTVAGHVTSVGFAQPAGEEYLFKVSLTLSGGSPRLSETREYHVTLRAMD